MKLKAWKSLSALILFMSMSIWVSSQPLLNEMGYIGISKEGKSGEGMQDTTSIMHFIAIGKKMIEKYPDSALQLFDKAIVASKNIGFDDGIALSMINRSLMYCLTGAYNDAITTLEKAIPYCKQSLHYRNALPQAYNMLGTAWRHNTDYNKVAYYYHLALAAAEKHAGMEELIAIIYNNYATMLTELDEPEKAQIYLNKGEKILRRNGNIKDLSSLLYNKAFNYLQNNRYVEAFPILEEALELSKEADNIRTQKLCLNGLAGVYMANNQPQKALLSIKRSYSLTPSSDPHIETSILATMGQVYESMKRYDLAEYYLLQQLTLASKFDMSASQMSLQAHKALSAIYVTTEDYPKAWFHLYKYVSIRDSLIGINKVLNINQMETKYRTAEKDKEIVEQQLLISRQQVHIVRNKWMLWLSVSVALLLALISLLMYRNMRHHRNLQQERSHVMQREQELKVLKAALSAEEKERIRIGKELHDGVGGLLSAIKINFSVIRMQNKNMEHSEAFKNVFSLMDEATDEIRKTAHNLMPEMLLKGGITEAVRNFCERIPKTSSLELQVLTYGSPIRLNSSLELSIYRIIQELINNIIRHSEASLGIIQMGWQHEKLTITIEDNGIGFNLEQIKEWGGIGLKNILDRVEVLNGQIDIESKEFSGTTIDIEFTFDEMKKKYHYD